MSAHGMGALPLLGGPIDPSECFEGLCVIAPFSLFRATAVIAVAWAIFLGSLLIGADRPNAKRSVIIWALPLAPIVLLLWQRDPARDLNFTGGVTGWVWGLAYAWFVRRSLRPAGARERDTPIEGLRKPWDLARVAFGLAIAGPFIGPILAGLLAAPFD